MEEFLVIDLHNPEGRVPGQRPKSSLIEAIDGFEAACLALDDWYGKARCDQLILHRAGVVGDHEPSNLIRVRENGERHDLTRGRERADEPSNLIVVWRNGEQIPLFVAAIDDIFSLMREASHHVP